MEIDPAKYHNSQCSLEAELCGKTEKEKAALIDRFRRKWFPKSMTSTCPSDCTVHNNGGEDGRGN